MYDHNLGWIEGLKGEGDLYLSGKLQKLERNIKL